MKKKNGSLKRLKKNVHFEEEDLDLDDAPPSSDQGDLGISGHASLPPGMHAGRDDGPTSRLPGSGPPQLLVTTRVSTGSGPGLLRVDAQDGADEEPRFELQSPLAGDNEETLFPGVASQPKSYQIPASIETLARVRELHNARLDSVERRLGQALRSVEELEKKVDDLQQWSTNRCEGLLDLIAIIITTMKI